jgi:hypothetical protein
LLYLCTKKRKTLAFAFLCFSLLVKSQFEILGFLVSSSIIIIVYAQRLFFFVFFCCKYVVLQLLGLIFLVSFRVASSSSQFCRG